MILRLFTASLVAALFGPAALAEPTGTAFTYQAELGNAGNPASGMFDLRFRLYDAAGGGAQVGAELCANDITVVAGRFTVQLDFGAQFAGQKRWLEIEVRADNGSDCADPTGFELLTPRQALTSAPSATHAASAATADSALAAATATTAGNAMLLGGQSPGFYQNAANLTGTLPLGLFPSTIARLDANQTFTGLFGFTNAANTFSGVFTGNGSGLTNISALNITTGTLANNRTTATTNNNPSTIVQRNASGNFSASVITATGYIGSGAALTNLDAGNISSGTIGNGRTTGTANNTPSTLVQRDGSGNFSAAEITALTFSGNGAALTGLDAANLALGTIANSRTTGTAGNTPGTLVLRDASGNFSAATISAAFSGNGAALTSINASNISSGTIGAARLPGSVVRTNQPNAFGDFTNSFVGHVGFGTTSPLFAIDATGPNASRFQFTDFPPDNVVGTHLVAQFLGSGAGPQIRFQRTTGGAFADLGQNGSGDFIIEGNDNIRFTVSSATGHVGIGTTNPQARLHVAGGQTILEQEPWQFPSLLGDWVNYGAGYADAAYFKDSVGVVHIRGTIRDGDPGSLIFVLPAGYRPNARLIFVGWSGSAATRVDILPDGRVYVLGTVSNGWLSLEGFSFRAEG
ncbi:MAG: hypothetical protein ACT4PL_13855 [Phycisphaerales bacterium]